MDLGEASGDESSFILDNLACRTIFNDKDPLAADNILVRWSFDKGPSLRSLQCLQLLQDSLLPLWPVISSLGLV